MKTPIDHLVFATPDVQESTAYLESLLGLPATVGGSHQGLGTCNTLLTLGPHCYLEVIGPDPAQSDFQGTRPFGIDSVTAGQLTAWVARRNDLTDFIIEMAAQGVELSDIIALSRKTPEGSLLRWSMSFLSNIDLDALSVLPLFIDWGQTPNPASLCQGKAELKVLEIEYPIHAYIQSFIDTLELDVSAVDAMRPGLRAVISCPNGEVELRTKAQ